MKSAFFAILSLLSPATAKASVIIYQHHFTGNSTSPLHGTTLETTNAFAGGTEGASWHAAEDRFQADGVSLSENPTTSAFVPFSPVTGYIYNISLTVDATYIGNTDSRFSMSLLAFSGSGNPNPNVGFTHGDTYATYATIGSRPLSYSNPPNSYNFLTWTGQGSLNGSHRNYSYEGPWTLGIVLDTTVAGAWTFQLVGSNEDGVFPLSPTGSIPAGTNLNYIMFNNHREISVTMSEFSVIAIPETSTVMTVSLLAFISAGVRRRRI